MFMRAAYSIVIKYQNNTLDRNNIPFIHPHWQAFLPSIGMLLGFVVYFFKVRVFKVKPEAPVAEELFADIKEQDAIIFQQIKRTTMNAPKKKTTVGEEDHGT